MSLQLQDRIRFVNQMGIITACTDFVLAGIYLSMGRSNLQALIIMGCFGLAVPFLNMLGLHLFTRITLSVAPALTISIFDISLKISKPENLEIISYITPRYAILCTLMLPLTLLMYKEKWLRNILVLAIVLAVFNFDVIFKNAGVHFSQIRPELAVSSRVYHLQWINYSIITIILLSTTYFLLYSGRKNGEYNEQLLQEARANTTRLQQSEAMLKETLALMQESKLELEHKSYVSTGLAHFLKLLRQEKDFVKLSQIILSQLASYMHIQQGALYWLNIQKSEHFLELKATYALTLEQMRAATFLPEEGLVGTVFTRQKMLHITNLPETYTYISTGLGEGKATEMIFLPLVVDEKGLGVIELSSFYHFEGHHIELLTQIAEAVATTLHNLEVSKRSDEMLEELQRFKSKVSYL
jgi:hypothetical protein